MGDEREWQMNLNLLGEVPGLDGMSQDELQEIMTMVRTKEFAPGQDIITEGDRGASMYIIVEGTAVCTKIGVNDGQVLREYEHGQFFGERAMLMKESRAATITAKRDPAPPVICLEITKKAYEKVLNNEDAANAMLDADAGYSHDNMLRSLFDEIDEDGGGSLDRVEITHLAEKLGIAMTPLELNEAFTQMDPDGSGEVDYVEFKDWFDAQTSDGGGGGGKFGSALRRKGAAAEDPFLHACVTGNIAQAHKLADKNEQEPHKLRQKWDTPGGSWVRSDVTPLFAACYSGHLLVVQFLIEECGADTTLATRKMDETPFWMACFKGHIAIVEYMLKLWEEEKIPGEAIGRSTVDTWTPLFGACYMGHLKVVKHLAETLDLDCRKVNSLGHVSHLAHSSALLGRHHFLKKLFAARSRHTGLRVPEGALRCVSTWPSRRRLTQICQATGG